MAHVSLSEEALRGFAESEARDPAIAKLASPYRVMHERRARGLPALLEGGRVARATDDAEGEADQ